MDIDDQPPERAHVLAAVERALNLDPMRDIDAAVHAASAALSLSPKAVILAMQTEQTEGAAPTQLKLL